MAFYKNLVRAFSRVLVGLVLIVLASGICARFTSVDWRVLLSCENPARAPRAVARIYLENAKLSSASLLSEAGGVGAEFSKQINALFGEHKSWIPAGGDEPFFAAFYSTLDKRPATTSVKLYSLLSTSDNREKLLNYLSQSGNIFVGKILSLRSLNSTLIPPVYTSAGAPLEAAILTSALLAQTGDMSQELKIALADTMEKSKGDSASREQLERFLLGELILSRDCDWVTLASLSRQFKTLAGVYNFAREYSKAKKSSLANARALLASALLTGSPEDCASYASLPNSKVEDLAKTVSLGGDALDKLLAMGLPIYSEKSVLSELLEPLINVVGEWTASLCAKHHALMLTFKIILLIVGGYLLARGLFRMFAPRRDTPAWYSPLALARGTLEGAVVALAFFAMLEPEAFKIKIASEPPPELRFTFEKITQTIGEDTMKITTDTATLAIIGTFFVMQSLVYVFSVIRLSSIKRLKASPELKLQLLDNEDNFFDLGLYIGLFGTVASLVMLSMGIVTASLMGAYTSTLFGILFTAFIKVGHVRRYKRKLLMEVSK